MKRVQLTSTVPVGQTRNFTRTNADGTDSPFTIPGGESFILTDISIQRLSGGQPPGHLTLDLSQAGQTHHRWTFVGQYESNIERSFAAGMVFSTPFTTTNSSISVDVMIVRLWGYLDNNA